MAADIAICCHKAPWNDTNIAPPSSYAATGRKSWRLCTCTRTVQMSPLYRRRWWKVWFMGSSVEDQGREWAEPVWFVSRGDWILAVVAQARSFPPQTSLFSSLGLHQQNSRYWEVYNFFYHVNVPFPPLKAEWCLWSGAHGGRWWELHGGRWCFLTPSRFPEAKTLLQDSAGTILVLLYHLGKDSGLGYCLIFVLSVRKYFCSRVSMTICIVEKTGGCQVPFLVPILYFKNSLKKIIKRWE